MRVLIFGATGMIGQGVLRECLLDDDVSEVITVGRAPVGAPHPKLRDVTLADVTDLSSITDQIKDIDACFFCLGVSAAGMSEEKYRAITFDITVAVATALSRLNPEMTFIYVSGAGTGSSRMMWAKVKRATENALLDLPFKGYMMRPGFIQPMHGIKSRTGWYRIMYKITRPLYPVVKLIAPAAWTSTDRLGRAMLVVARQGAPKLVLETRDISALS